MLKVFEFFHALTVKRLMEFAWLGTSIGVGPDTGLILSQTALELLAWTYCVQDQKMVSPEAFKQRSGLKASDKFRLLMSSLDIPKEVPRVLSALHGNPGKKWIDGLHAITDIRNSLVHPDSNSIISGNSYYEACQLSLWYLDLVLLHLCGHNGNYANRLLVSDRCQGEVEPVPWAYKATKIT